MQIVHGDGSAGDPMMFLGEVAAAPAGENDSDTNMEIRYIPEGDFRTDLRRKHKYSQEQKKLLDDFEVYLAAIKQCPYIWLEDDVQFLRDFVATVNNDQEHFPPSLPPPAGPLNEDSPVTEPTPPLNKDFISRIYSREIQSDWDCQPIGLVTACSSKFQEIHHSSLNKIEQKKIYTLHVADGDGNVVTVKVASQLTSLMHRITVGTVLKLLRFNPVPFLQSTSPSAQLRIALIVTNFEICGSMEVPEALIKHPRERLEVQLIPPGGAAAEVVGANEGSTSTTIGTLGSEAVSSGGPYKYDDPYLNALWMDLSQWEPVENPVCSPENRLCSKYGVRFDICVCNAIPIRSL
jgi:hypothetical protein